MKTMIKTKWAGVAFAAIAFVGLAQSAKAIPLTWLDGPQVGQAFTTGATFWKFNDYDAGTIYTGTYSVGTAFGYGQAGGAGSNTSGTSIATGDSILNGLPQVGPTAGVGTEDTWGIIKVSDIQAVNPIDNQLHYVFNSLVSPYELTAMFRGEQDFYFRQVVSGTGGAFGGALIDGAGLHIDVYMDASKNFNYAGGPTARTSGTSYPTVTDGSLELTFDSTPGFINHAGTLGGVATEFESNTAATGYAAFNITGGASASQFNTNGIGFGGSYGASFVPGDVTNSTDVWFAFTTIQGTNGWLINSNDPAILNAIPEPTTVLAGFACMLPLAGAAVRRCRKLLALM